MKRIETITYQADDGTPFDTELECAAYEARLPFNRLFAQVSDAARDDADFALKIERLGRAFAAERVASGNRLRGRRAPVSGHAEAAPDAPCDVQPTDEYEPGDMTEAEPT